MLNSMLRLPKDLVSFVSFTRWAIPLAVACLGTAYVIFEQVWLKGDHPGSPHLIRTVLFLFIVGPTLSWVLLTLTLHLAQSQANVQRELAARSVIGDVTAQSLDLAIILDRALRKLVEFMELPAGEIRLVEGDQLVLKASVGVSSIQCREKGVHAGDCACCICAQLGDSILLNDLFADPRLPNVACARAGFRSVIAIPMSTKAHVLGVILLASPKPSAICTKDQRMLTAIGSRVAMAVENAQLYGQAHRRARHLEIASILGQRMTSVLDLDKLLGDSVKLIRQKFGYYHTSILLVDTLSGELVLKEASGAGAEALKAHGLRLKIGQKGITASVAYSGQALLCNDVSREPRYLAADSAPETRAELAVPLRAGRRVIGVLDVQSDRRNAFDKEDITLLQILGSQVGSAIETARLYQETKQRYEAMVALHDTSLDMIAQLDTPQLLASLLRRGAELVGAQGGALFLYDPSRELAACVAHYNTRRDMNGLTFQPGEGVAGNVILTGKPVIVNDYANWEGKSQGFRDTRLTRIIGVPLKWEDRFIGSISFIGYKGSRPFCDTDIWLASQFADLAAIAVKNAELHTQISQFNQELEGKIVERTLALTRAKDETAIKADQLRSLWAKTIQIQEQERARIALDMHDGVIQLITAARFQLKALRTTSELGLPAAAEERLDAVHQVLDEMEDELRRAIYDLHPPILNALGLTPALQKYVLRFQELSGIACHFQAMGIPRALSQATEIAIFRIVEESLHNVAVHAQATESQIVLEFGPDRIDVAVQDNGCGLAYPQQRNSRRGDHGLGLLGMQERVRSVNGEMDVSSLPGQGTRLTFHIPVEPIEG